MDRKEAIEVIKNWPDSSFTRLQNALETLIPELKESEDGRMWGLIKKYAHYNISDLALEADHITREQLESWLKKQSEHANFLSKIQVGDKVTRNDNGKLVNLSQLERVAKPSIPEIVDEHWYEMLDDKVEPKFKVDDWIVNKGHSYLIGYIDYEQRRYLFEVGGYTHEQVNWEYIENVDSKYHLWTIQDAKDGDVLCTYECDEPKIVFILKGTPKKHCALRYHCYYNIMYPHFESYSESGCLAPNDEDVKPATKEQRDILFQKMKETGYKWDAEKKELKKIEQVFALLIK